MEAVADDKHALEIVEAPAPVIRPFNTEVLDCLGHGTASRRSRSSPSTTRLIRRQLAASRRQVTQPGRTGDPRAVPAAQDSMPHSPGMPGGFTTILR